jgi:16S rRNA processing protein RimM
VEKSNLIAIAHILRPQGRKGEVLAELLTDQLSQFQTGRAVQLLNSEKPQAQVPETVLENHWLPVGKNAGRIVLKLKGTESISQAETLSGLEVAIAAADLPKLEEDTFYVKDLLGCSFVDGERVLGEVADVQFVTSTDGKVRLQDAAPLLAVQLSADQSAEPALVPLVRAYLVSVDVAAKRIVMNLPPGLIDLQSEEEAPKSPEA